MSSNYSAAQVCDASLIEALKTKYTHVSSSVIDKALYQAACTKSQTSDSIDASINIMDVANIGFGGDGKTVRQACYTKDYTFFAQHSAELTTSFLPKSAIQQLTNCFGGLTFSATTKDALITITARYVNLETRNPTNAKPLAWVPDNALIECKGELTKPGIITAGGQLAICKRDPKQRVIVYLDTVAGDRAITVEPDPTIVTTEYKGHTKK